MEKMEIFVENGVEVDVLEEKNGKRGGAFISMKGVVVIAQTRIENWGISKLQGEHCQPYQ